MMYKTFYWSVRREMWENRSIFFRPCFGAALFVAAFAARRILWPGWAVEGESLAHWCKVAAGLLCLLSIANALFYSLDALQGERRDRSILFWKSMPVSDLVTVLSKASIPFAVIPVITFITILATQLLLALIGGGFPAELPDMTLKLLLGLPVMVLWQAPLYAWVLLVSGWARRSVPATVLLVPMAACLVEKLVFSTSRLFGLLTERLTFSVFSIAENGAAYMMGGSRGWMTSLAPSHLAANPDMGIGVAVAAVMLAAAIRSRRYRQPV